MPIRVREHWMFVCPECSHKTELPNFSALGASSKCFQPVFISAARGWKENVGRLVARTQSLARTKLNEVAGEAIDKMRRRYGVWSGPHSRRRRDCIPHFLMQRWK